MLDPHNLSWTDNPVSYVNRKWDDVITRPIYEGSCVARRARLVAQDTYSEIYVLLLPAMMAGLDDITSLVTEEVKIVILASLGYIGLVPKQSDRRARVINALAVLKDAGFEEESAAVLRVLDAYLARRDLVVAELTRVHTPVTTIRHHVTAIVIIACIAAIVLTLIGLTLA